MQPIRTPDARVRSDGVRERVEHGDTVTCGSIANPLVEGEYSGQQPTPIGMILLMSGKVSVATCAPFPASAANMASRCDATVACTASELSDGVLTCRLVCRSRSGMIADRVSSAHVSDHGPAVRLAGRTRAS